jgi:hypothetical protein
MCSSLSVEPGGNRRLGALGYPVSCADKSPVLGSTRSCQVLLIISLLVLLRLDFTTKFSSISLVVEALGHPICTFFFCGCFNRTPSIETLTQDFSVPVACQIPRSKSKQTRSGLQKTQTPRRLQGQYI